jgi:Family of unknown function (DUF6328)
LTSGNPSTTLMLEMEYGHESAPSAPPDSDKDLSELDDEADRDELRRRYDILLQEIRISLPGVQILLAFLLTVPFAQRFGELDVWGRRAFGLALTSAMLSVICLVTPSLLHRLGTRTARSARLRWSIRAMLVGLALLATALVAAMWSVARFVFGDALGWWLTMPVVIFFTAAWVVLPLTLRRFERRTSRPAQTMG